MGVFSILMKGDDLVGDYSVKLRKGRNLKYLKLLHLYTNINSSQFKADGNTKQAVNAERLLFAKFSFLNTDNYDNFNEANSYVSLGASAHGSKTDKLITRDLYKILLDKPIIRLEGQIVVRIYFLDSDGVIRPLKSKDIVSSVATPLLSTELSFLNLILEYEEI